MRNEFPQEGCESALVTFTGDVAAELEEAKPEYLWLNDKALDCSRVRLPSDDAYPERLWFNSSFLSGTALEEELSDISQAIANAA